MNEALPVFLWKYRVLGREFQSTDGEPIVVYSPGTENRDGGPDFLNARIRIGETLWAGNVEVHWLASDWRKHGHDRDPVYESVILHVVMKQDEPAIVSNGRKLTSLSLQDYAGEDLLDKYKVLSLSHQNIPCSRIISHDGIHMPGPWLTRLAVERLESRAKSLVQQLMWEGGQWDRIFTIHLFRSYGLPVNTEPFSRLGGKFLTLDLSDSWTAEELEAVLFYLSGLISPGSGDPYLEKMISLAKPRTATLPPLPGSIWKWLRMRPVGFPSIRLAQLAVSLTSLAAITHKQRLVLEIQDWRDLLSQAPGAYWDNHYRPGIPTARVWPKKPGKHFVDSLIINAIIPYMVASAHYDNDSRIMARAVGMLEACQAEDNHIIRQWREIGISPCNATESQGLVELYHAYCSRHACLHCRIGYLVMQEGS